MILYHFQIVYNWYTGASKQVHWVKFLKSSVSVVHLSLDDGIKTTDLIDI